MVWYYNKTSDAACVFAYSQVWIELELHREDMAYEKSNIFTVGTHGRKYTKIRQK